MLSQYYLSLLFMVYIIKISIGELFLASPGDGEQFVYSPVDVNATLHCTVNSAILTWIVDRIRFDNNIRERVAALNSREIFQTTNTSGAITYSTLTVYGDININNHTSICCESYNRVTLMDSETCTTLVIYDRPLPPENVSVRYTRALELVDISWTAIPMMGVEQNYIIFFYSQNIIAHSDQLFYSYQQNTSDSKIRCNAFITAVNGAGESDPSNNVTIPSLPDIGPVTASLSHQVWKSTGGEIMVNVSFKPALYCVDYPVLAYVLKLRSEQTSTESVIETYLEVNKTEIVIKPQNELESDVKYVYTVTAVNIIGNTSNPLDGRQFLTSDVQSVTATVVGESTIDIQCLFIYGSDAVGCKVVLVSDHPSVNNETATFIRRHTSASAQLNLTHKVTCYHRVFAYTIDVNNITNIFFIEEKLNSNINIMTFCSATGNGHSPLVAIIVSIILTLLAVAIFVIALSVRTLKKTRETRRKKSRDDTKSNCYVSTKSKPQTYKTEESDTLTQTPTPTLQNKDLDKPLQRSSQSSPPYSPPNTPLTSVPNSHDQKLVMCTYSSKTTIVDMPLYAVPEKIKMKENLKKEQIFCQQIQKEESGSLEGKINTEENLYHGLENDEALSKCDVTTLVSPTPELPPPMETGSSESNTPPSQTTIHKGTPSMPLICDEVGNKVTNNGCDNAKALAVPLYAVPDKVRLRNRSVLSQSSCVSALQEESGELNNVVNKETLEHFYHVLEVNKAPHKGKEAPPDSNAPELPPPFKPGAPPSDPPPIYQDIITLTHNN